MALQDSYPILMEQAATLQRDGRYAEAADTYLRVVSRLNNVSNETLEKREDLEELPASYAEQGRYLAYQ